MAGKPVSNRDLLGEIREVGSAVENVRLEVRGGEDQRSRDESLRGQVLNLRRDFNSLSGRMGALEGKMETPPVQMAKDAKDAADDAGRKAVIFIRYGRFTAAVTAAGLAAFVAFLMGWIQWPH